MRLIKNQFIVLAIVLVILISSSMRGSDILVKGEGSSVEPVTTVTDYHNGTVCTIIDYGNGTQDFTIETTTDRSAMLYGDNNQSIPLVIDRPNEPKSALSTETLVETQTEVINQQILMRWEYTVYKGRWETGAGTWLAWVEIGVYVDIEFGIRLPVNITIEYQSPVSFDGSNTTMYAVITPIDLPDFNESLCIFKSYFYVKCGGVLIGGPYEWRYGPDYDLSQSFMTPLGNAIAFPIPPIPALWLVDLNIPLIGSDFLDVYLGVQPGFGSRKITAAMSTIGDAQTVQGASIVWSYPNQSVPFIVRFGDYDPSVDWAIVRLSDFRYYFTQFYIRFWLMFDFAGWIDWVLHDFNVDLGTIDMSWLIRDQDWHVGSAQSIDLWFRQPLAVHDIAVTDVALSNNKCYPGDSVDIAVVVENKGTSTEAFNLSLYYNENLISIAGMSQVLENKTSRTLHFEWNTTSVPLGNYTIKAVASFVQDEIDTTNNEKTDGNITIALYTLLAIVVDTSDVPIPNAKVEIIGQQQATTDTNGEAQFSLARGSYAVRASKGPLNNSINVDLVGDTTVKITLWPEMPVGGYTVSVKDRNTALPSFSYFAMVILLSIAFIGCKGKTRKKM